MVFCERQSALCSFDLSRFGPLTFQLIDWTAHWRMLRQAEARHISRAGHEMWRMIQQLCRGRSQHQHQQQQRCQQQQWPQQRGQQQHVAVANFQPRPVIYLYPLARRIRCYLLEYLAHVAHTDTYTTIVFAAHDLHCVSTSLPLPLLLHFFSSARNAKQDFFG